jgi:hypothetical protein
LQAEQYSIKKVNLTKTIPVHHAKLTVNFNFLV